MSASTVQNQSTGLKIGHGLLLFLAVGNVLGHIGLLLFISPNLVFVAWAVFNFLAAAVLWFPYRRGEK